MVSVSEPTSELLLRPSRCQMETFQMTRLFPVDFDVTSEEVPPQRSIQFPWRCCGWLCHTVFYKLCHHEDPIEDLSVNSRRQQTTNHGRLSTSHDASGDDRVDVKRQKIHNGTFSRRSSRKSVTTQFHKPQSETFWSSCSRTLQTLWFILRFFNFNN